MTASEVLRKARALIDKPESWTQGAYARTADGKDLPPKDEQACAWCILGAVHQVADGGGVSVDAIETLVKALPTATAHLPNFNDTHTHAEVLSLFDRAIAAAEARGE